ncbi:hypothetical protein [Streptomyces sp. NPDC058045]|uniref:hypothetical protein n=1 Tax=Streptomyces sp. NPDC058045 TaxID=3346311 RepID=UPI0036E21FDE
MTHNSPLFPSQLTHPGEVRTRVVGTAQLRAHGVSAAETDERCRAGGPWQQILPGVFLLRPGPPTGEERLHAALRYAVRPATRRPRPPAAAVPQQHDTVGCPAPPAVPPSADGYPDAMVTGLAALALHGFPSAPPLPVLDRVDILVPRSRRLRSAGFARLVRSSRLPAPQQRQGVPVAPVPRALADAVAGLDTAPPIRRLLTEAVRGGHCEAPSVVRELNRARLLGRPQVADAVESLLAEGRALDEDALYRLVREHGLSEPLWNVELRLPGGPCLGAVDAYWPGAAVAVELDTRAPRPGEELREDDLLWSEHARRREHLEGLGIALVRIPPHRLRESAAQQAAVVRTALMAADDREPAAYVVVLPR